jgi:hypothetical protein
MTITPKIRFAVVGLLLLTGLGFVVFAVFFNRGHLELTANAPFSVNIAGLRQENCPSSPCRLTLAPGKYDLQIFKTEFLPINDQVTVSLGQTIAKEYQLIPLPKLQVIGPYKPDEKASEIYYLADHPKTFLPALFKKDLSKDSADKKPSEPLINFIRAFKNPRLIVNNKQDKVAIIEQPDQQSASLYLIDLNAKTRQVIDQNGLIKNLLWLPAAPGEPQKFIIEKINSETFQSDLFISSTNTPQTQTLLPLSASLSTMQALDSNHLLVVQPLGNPSDNTTSLGFNLVKFSLADFTNQQIFSDTTYSTPTKIDYQPATQSVLLVIGDNVYSLGPFL